MLETVKTLLLGEYSVGQWALVFFLFSFVGWCWEVSLYLVKERRFVNRGFLTGPILPIYGFGALLILLTCVPVQQSVLAVALLGTLTASMLEYVTGWAMERLFHVRYWDYSDKPFNLNGHICLLSAGTWAVFSAVLVCVVHPLMKPVLGAVEPKIAAAASVALVGFALVDTVFAVRRALDLRALLMSMERYAKELQALHGGLDTLSERIGDMIRAFAARVDERQEEMAARVAGMASARERVAQMMADKRMSLEEGARERFASFERILAEAANYLPDVTALREEIAAAKEKYDRQTELLRQARLRRLRRAQRALRDNPSAASRRYSSAFEALRSMGKDSDKEA